MRRFLAGILAMAMLIMLAPSAICASAPEKWQDAKLAEKKEVGIGRNRAVQPRYEMQKQAEAPMTVTAAVYGAPVIVTQPRDYDITEGGNGVFSLEADGADSYQWYGPIPLVDAQMVSVESVDHSWQKDLNGIWQSQNKHIDSSEAKFTAVFDVAEGDLISFDWMVSSERGYDKLSYTLQNQEQQIMESGSISGTSMVEFERVNLRALLPGQYTLQFTYSKDRSSFDGQDCGWVKFQAIEALEGQTSSTLEIAEGSVSYYDGAPFYCIVSAQDKNTQSDTAYLVKEHTVTFDLNYEGSPNTSEKVLTNGTIPMPQDPERVGYTFIGWAENPEGPLLDPIHILVSKDMTLYAIWTKQLAGNGSQQQPYLLTTQEDLLSMARQISAGLEGASSAHYQMTADISFSDTTVWTMIHEFNGQFDGNGKTIDGLRCQDGSRYAALFYYIGEDGVVKNLTMGEQCILNGSFAAGIVGTNEGTLASCVNRGIVTAEETAAGIAGENYGSISNCINYGPITSGGYAGGIAAYNNGGIKECKNFGSVKGDVPDGIVSENEGAVNDCENHGTIIPYPPEDYTISDTEVMAYRKSDDFIDAKALYHNRWISTTFSDEGYGAVYDPGVYKLELEPAFANKGNFVKLQYKLTALQDVEDGIFGVYADIMIGENDNAPISILYDNDEKPIGMKMADAQETNQSFGAQFNLFFSNTYGVTDADSFWFGYYYPAKNNTQTNLREYLEQLDWQEDPDTPGGMIASKGDEVYTYNQKDGLQLVKTDSGMAVGWNGINMRAGETRTFSLLVGVGSADAVPPVSYGLQFDEGTGNVIFDVEDKDAQVTDGRVTNPLTLFYSLDDAAEQEVLAPLVTVGGDENRYHYSFPLEDLAEGFHTINVWAMNEAGMLTAVKRIGIPVWTVPTYKITGRVHETDGTPAAETVVTLKKGTEKFAEAIAGEDGSFVFDKVPEGVYNIVFTTSDGITVTKELRVHQADLDAGITVLPEGRTNSIVETTVSAPKAVADGLNDQFDSDVLAQDTEKGVTQEDLDTVKAGGSVTIKLLVDQKTKEEATGADQILALLNQEQKIGMYLDISVQKNVADSAGQPIKEQSGSLSELQKPITLRITLPEEHRGKSGYVVYRAHGGQVDVLSETPNGAGEYMKTDGTDLILSVNRFSTYAVGYTSSYRVLFDSQGADKEAVPAQMAVVEPDTTIAALPAAPEKAGFQFAGWWTQPNGEGAEFTAQTAVEKNMTLYAKWVPKQTVIMDEGTQTVVYNGSVKSYEIKGTSLPLSSFQISYSQSGVEIDPVRPGTYDVTITRLEDGEYAAFHKVISGGLVIRTASGPSQSTGKPTTYVPGKSSSEEEEPVDVEWKNPYGDVSRQDWFYENVKFVSQRNWMTGTAADQFAPYMDLTRAMFVTVLYRMEGQPSEGIVPFSDVPENSYYEKAVAWASSAGIVKGITETVFAPEQRITREQMSAILHRYAQYKGHDVSQWNDLSGFLDAPSAWALADVQWAVGAGMIQGRGNGALAPGDPATRAEIAAVIMRYYNKNMK